MLNPEHPDTVQAYHALKQIQRGGRQAIEDSAIEAYHKAYEQGRGEAERVYFEHFNKVSNEQK
jgi:hypothetical protein